ncbi:MAG: cytochrome c3 family protein [Pyrinomonadaceae bacterium]
MKRYRSPVLVTVRAVAFVVFLCLLVAGFLYFDPVAGSFAASQAPMPTPVPRTSSTPRPARYSQFPHNVKAHRVSCDQCHKFPSDNWKKVRTEKDAFPDVTEYPKHESCLNCHKQQFFKGAKPAICSVCHTNPSPRNSARHAFPNPREVFDTTPKGRTATSDFAVTFPHDKHVEIVSRVGRREEFANASWTRGPSQRRAEESCSVCHQTYKPQDKSDDEYVTTPPAPVGDAFWLKKGTFKTAPIGHTTCFTCHSADTRLPPAPENCAACHTLKVPDPPADFDPKLPLTMGIDDKLMLTSWRRRGSSGKFRHEWFSHAELSCSTCHNVSTISTADPNTTKVSINACAACHVTATSDDGGALNFETDARKANVAFQCVKCHITFGKSAIPESHLKAIAGAK